MSSTQWTVYSNAVQQFLSSFWEEVSFVTVSGSTPRAHRCSEGLDKITEGFQLIAGNVTLSKTGIWLMLSAAIIFIAQFSLYFEMTKGNGITKSRRLSEPYCRRVLAWFFFQLVFHTALIIMLQGQLSDSLKSE